MYFFHTLLYLFNISWWEGLVNFESKSGADVSVYFKRLLFFNTLLAAALFHCAPIITTTYCKMLVVDDAFTLHIFLNNSAMTSACMQINKLLIPQQGIIL